MPDPNLTLVSTVDLMQEGISSALAVLSAIEGAELFRDLPQDATAVELHNHGCSLLNLLADSLRRIQAEVDGRGVQS